MRIIGILAIIIVYIWACSSSAPSEKKVSGSAIYKTRCVSCHGMDGRMGLNGAKALPSSPLSLEERVAVVTKGRNAVMPAFESLLSKEQIDAVAAYTMKMK